MCVYVCVYVCMCVCVCVCVCVCKTYYLCLHTFTNRRRKDERVQEFDTLINRLLRQSDEARRRDLRVRTYAVVPLSETTGVLEWVSNTVPLRVALVQQYLELGIWKKGHTSRDALKQYNDATTSDAKRIVFRRLLAQFPSVLHRWFVAEFPDASDWLNARLNYTRSCAVMSMVGFALGLGDRHSENMLLDKVNGDFIHIDLKYVVCIIKKQTLATTTERTLSNTVVYFKKVTRFKCRKKCRSG
jgi:serine/threonine-protein kinase ATR